MKNHENESSAIAPIPGSATQFKTGARAKLLAGLAAVGVMMLAFAPIEASATSPSPGITYGMSVDSFIAKYTNAGSVTDPAGNYLGQCVSLIKRYHVEVVGGAMYALGGNGGAFNEWDLFASIPELKSHYTQVAASSAVKKGDIVVWGPTSTNQYGHIALVTSDAGAGASFTVLESNYKKSGGNGIVSTRNVTTRSNVRGFLRPVKVVTPPTPSPTVPVIPAAKTAKVMTNSNLRSGPGTNYPVQGSAASGTTIGLVCYQYGGSATGYYGSTTLWYKTNRSGWWILDANVYTGTNLPVTPKC